MSLTQDGVDRSLIAGLVVFAAGVGLLTTVGLVLIVMRLAADTATALAAAAPVGVAVTVSLRKGK